MWLAARPETYHRLSQRTRDNTAVVADHKRLQRLKQYTADDNILNAPDRIAFTQEELNDLLCSSVSDKNTIYLCGEHFVIPGGADNIAYVGIKLSGVCPKFVLDDAPVGTGISFQNLEFDVDDFFSDGDISGFFQSFSLNKPLGFQILHVSAEKSIVAMTALGKCYQEGFGVETNDGEAVKWYKKAAELGDARAQSRPGYCYRQGKGVAKDTSESAKAAEQGDTAGQTMLGVLYERGDGVKKDLEKAVSWYQKAATQGKSIAQYYLGLCYRDGKGVTQDKDEAVKLLQEATSQGNNAARNALIEMVPTMFRLSDVVLYVVGGKQNLIEGTKIDAEIGKIDILVEDRHKINETVFFKFGSTNVWIEPKYFVGEKVKNPTLQEVAEAFKELGKLVFTGIGILIKDQVKMSLFNEPPSFDDLNFDMDYFVEIETDSVSEDLGGGWIHIQFEGIDSDMVEDFNKNVKSQCRTSEKEKMRENQLQHERLLARLDRLDRML